MNTARVFQSGNSQAVRLPKEFRFASNEVEIFRRGNEIVLREKPSSLGDAFDALAELPEDMIAALENFQDGPPQEREGLE